MNKIIITLFTLALFIQSCSKNSTTETNNLNCPNTTDPTNLEDGYRGPVASEEEINLIELNIEYFPVSENNPNNDNGKYYQISGKIQNIGEDEFSGNMYFVYNVGNERHIIVNGSSCLSLMLGEICEFDFPVARNIDFIEDPNPELICFFYRLIE